MKTTPATNTFGICNTYWFSAGNNGRTNVPQFYVISALFFCLQLKSTNIYYTGSEGNLILILLVFILDQFLKL
jgi:hypothetical protein